MEKSKEKRAVPSLRFPGFDDVWMRHKVTELGGIYIGLVTTMTSHYTDHGTLLIRNSDIKDGRFEFGDNPIYLDDEFAAQNASRKHMVGDVITVHTGDIGTSAVITEKEAGSIGFATIVTRPYKERISSEYLCAYLNTDAHKNFAMSISTGDGRNNYNLKDYYECVVPVPSMAEQKKISGFIYELNNTITLHLRKCDNMKELKKGLLQKMFPKQGEKVPEIRFSGFTGDWEQRKLSDLTDSIDTGKSKFEVRDNGKYEILGSTSVIGYDESYDYEGDFILTARVGANAGNLYRHSGKVKISDNTVFLQGKHLDFIYYLLDSYDIKKLSFGTGQPLVKASELKSLDLMVPQSETEKQKIGEFLTKLDDTITLHQRKCDELKELKKGLLQQMFV